MVVVQRAARSSKIRIWAARLSVLSIACAVAGIMTFPHSFQESFEVSQVLSVLFDDDDDVPPKVHVVFSTGCSDAQDWQSYVFFYHAWKVGQPGHVTRIASGCSPERMVAIQDAFSTQIRTMSDRFHLYLTPEYSKSVVKGLNYRFFNKPFGLRDWFEHVIRVDDQADWHDTVFVILDPDQILVQPLFGDFNGTTVDWEGGHPTTTRVQHGQPIGQLYEMGVGYVDKLVKGSEKIFGNASAAPNWDDKRQIYSHYNAGPPYMATGKDMSRLVDTWANLTRSVYMVTQDHLSEMYAYVVAAMHLQLPHQLGHSFMVSSPVVREGFPLTVDRLEDHQVCGCAHEQQPTTRPFLLHYCQAYYMGPHFFFKQLVPDSILSCDHDLLREVPSTVTDYRFGYMFQNGLRDFTRREHTDKFAKRSAYMLCQVIPRINEALVHFKQNHCEKPNMDKTWEFPIPPIPASP